MWNRTHTRLLSKVISSTRTMMEAYLPLELLRIRQVNEQSCNYERMLSLSSIDSLDHLTQIHAVCKFLVFEFATLVEETGARLQETPSYIVSKLLGYERSKGICLGYREFFSLSKELTREFEKAKGTQPCLDVLFVTAFPTEFLAIVRRLDFYFKATHPDRSRGFSEGNLPPGWVVGAVRSGRRNVLAGVVCASRYGPAPAATGVESFIKCNSEPKHIIVVGVGASLGEANELRLGDIAYSERIDDISLGKDESETLVSNVEVMTAPGLNALGGQSLRYPSYSESEISRLKLLLVTRECSKDLIRRAEKNSLRSDWCKRIHLPRPDGTLDVPGIISTPVLSGSRVVKDASMREYLRERFPGRLLLEMESCGVAQLCEDNGFTKPIVIKSVCDWATASKEKSWQPYCADVASAFAIEVAVNK